MHHQQIPGTDNIYIFTTMGNFYSHEIIKNNTEKMPQWKIVLILGILFDEISL